MPDATDDRGLRLVAQDEDDLNVLSAALQDAIVRVGDIVRDPVKRSVTLAASRFRWERAGRRGANERVRAALRVDGVMGMRARGLARESGDALAVLMSIGFEAGAEPPGGVITLTFAGDGGIALEVECIDMVLADISRPWPTRRRPDHGV